MSKRKREDVAENEDATTTVNYRQQRRIVDAFTQSTNELAKAFKTARGFERQKLGRRKKNSAAGKDSKDIGRIDSEVVALKTLDMTTCAQHYLQKCLLKAKAVATSPQLPPQLGRPVPLSKDNAALNVNARLCNSNPVKVVFPTLLASVKREFGIEEKVDVSAKKRRIRAKDFEESQETTVDDASSEADVDIGEGSSSKALPTRQRRDIDDDDLEHDSDVDMDIYSTRLASSDDGESEVEFGSDIEDIENQLANEGIARTSSNPKASTYNHTADLSFSEAESATSPEPNNEPPKSNLPRKSSFIPSLTLGGYISGSGSDISDDDLDTAPKKNNRRGQRARQQIWEQKYGKNAKHLQNQERSAGWDAKRGAVHGRDKQGQRGPRPDRFAKGANMERLGQSRLSNAAPAKKKPPHKDNEGPLHPSWEAAKRAKEKKAVPVAFQGKKISFD